MSPSENSPIGIDRRSFAERLGEKELTDTLDRPHKWKHDWACRVCGNENRARRMRCLFCRRLREGAAP